MTDKEKLVLRKNYAFLVKKLDAASIRSSLNAEGLLTDYELAEVQAQSVAPAANELILAALKRRAPGFLEKFCRVLEEEPANQHIVDKLREGRQLSRSYVLMHPTVTLMGHFVRHQKSFSPWPAPTPSLLVHTDTNPHTC